MDHRLCIELGITNPPGANFCYNCGTSLAPPEPPTEPRWGLYVRNYGINEIVDNTHETAAAAVKAALEMSPDIIDSPMPFFVALVGPGMRIHELRPLTPDPTSRQFAIGDPTDDHDEFLKVSFLENDLATGND